MPALLAPATWCTDAAAEVVVDALERAVAPDLPRDLLAEKSGTMVAAFLDALTRQGLSLQSVGEGEWVDLEWLAAEISIQGDWRGLPSDPYDFEDARGVARSLVSHVRDSVAA